MIKFKCPHCAKEISAADEHAGRKAKCPKCQTVMVIPGAKAAPAPPPAAPPKPVVPAVEDEIEEAVEEAPPPARKPAYPAVKAGKPPRQEYDEDVQDVEAVEEADDEEEDDRPRRRRKGGRRRRWHGEWADCPNCGAPGDATRLTWTIWGGFIGPMIINHVRCNQCGTTYNGKSGDYNTTRIIIYYAINFGIGLVIFFLVVCLGALNGDH
jgi:phage FluMu protein Com